MSDYILKCENVSKNYIDSNNRVDVLSDLNLKIKPGDISAIVGPSGSGKSTLLHLLGGLDLPSSGDIFINGKNWQKLSEKDRCKERNYELGFIYQFHHLLPEFTALENVAMPLLIRKASINLALESARKILDKVGLIKRLNHKPSELSGGERARVAIARALVHNPKCILADEPTGNLDKKTANIVFDLMLEINRENNAALVIVTHDDKIAAKTNRVLNLNNGNFKDI